MLTKLKEYFISKFCRHKMQGIARVVGTFDVISLAPIQFLVSMTSLVV